MESDEEFGIPFLKLCCKLLSSYGVTEIIMAYDGGGDSGCFDDTIVKIQTPEKEILGDISNPQMHDMIDRQRVKSTSLSTFVHDRQKEENPIITPEMCQKLEDTAMDLLPSGWEINEGSYGRVCIDIATEQIRVEHNERYTEIRTENFTY